MNVSLFSFERIRTTLSGFGETLRLVRKIASHATAVFALSISLFLFVFVTPCAQAQDSGPFSYSGTTQYTRGKGFSFFGYGSSQKRETVPPPVSMSAPAFDTVPSPASASSSVPSSVDIPLTSATGTNLSGETVVYESGSSSLPQSSNGSGGVYPVDPSEVAQYQMSRTNLAANTTNGEGGDVSADDRLSRFMLFPRKVRHSLLQGVGADLAYVPDRKEERAGYYQVGGAVTFGIPMPSEDKPLLVSPLFSWTQFDMPKETDALFAEKKHLYAPGLKAEYLAPVNERLMFDFAMSVRWCSDFSHGGIHDPLIGGYGSAILKLDEYTRLVLGLGYNDVGRYKIMPFGGLLWRASECLYLEVLFPKPRISWRLPRSMQDGNDHSSYWLYFSGEYHAERWSVYQDYNLPEGFTEEEYRLTYDDFRAFVGIERKSLDCIDWAFEGGLVFSRRLTLTDRDGHVPCNREFHPKPAGIVQMKIRY